jgi:hypothetical protein
MGKVNDFLPIWLKKANKSMLLFWAVVVIFAMLSTYFLINRWTQSINGAKQQAVSVAETGAVMIRGSLFMQLGAVKEDLGTPAYESVKNRLVKLIEINHDASYAYIYTQRDNRIYYMVTSAQAGSKDDTLPGQEFTEASAAH